MFPGLDYGSGRQKMRTPFPIKRDRGFFIGIELLAFKTNRKKENLPSQLYEGRARI